MSTYCEKQFSSNKNGAICLILLAISSIFSSFAWCEEAPGRKEVEKHLFPLLKEADKIEIFAVYPLPQKYLQPQPDAMELTVVFGLIGDDAQKKMTETDKKMAALARKAPIVAGYPAFGKVTVSEPEEIKVLLGEMREMTIASDDDGVEEQECHDPRHALRVTKGELTLHFSICFDCGNTFISGVPEDAEKGAEGFHHFKDELREILEKRLAAKGITFLKAPGSK